MIRRSLHTVAVLATCASIAIACGEEVATETLPSIELTPLDDEFPVTLDAIDGPAVVNLWYSTCAPCVRELPDFQAVADERDDVGFYGINIGEDAATASEFLDELGVTFDQYLDPGGYVSTELGVTMMPTTLVIDAAGELSERHFGAMDVDELNEAIDAAIDSSAR